MSETPEVIETITKELPKIIKQETSKMVETHVDAVSLMESVSEFFTHVGVNIGYYLVFFYNTFGTFLHGVLKYFYQLIYVCIEYWFLHGPRWWWLNVLKGNGGIPEKDICANMIGTNSDSFEGPGLLVCQEYIHHVINERALFVSVLFVSGYIKYGIVPTWNFFHSLYNHQDFLDKKKKRELANEKSIITRKRNEEINVCFRAMCVILHDDEMDFDKQINSLRNILNNINNDDVLDLINWRPVLGKEWESQKLSKNRRIIKAIGDGS